MKLNIKSGKFVYLKWKIIMSVNFENIFNGSTEITHWTSMKSSNYATTAESNYENDRNDIFYQLESDKDTNNYWALLALFLVFGTAAGNILVCLAIVWDKRLQNVTNYFLMSLAITDLMVAILVMPLGILTLVRGKSNSNIL